MISLEKQSGTLNDQLNTCPVLSKTRGSSYYLDTPLGVLALEHELH
jgi:hypothetical protein